ncbi:hypothetical protein YC2023_026299 [Brassica napus]
MSTAATVAALIGSFVAMLIMAICVLIIIVGVVSGVCGTYSAIYQLQHKTRLKDFTLVIQHVALTQQVDLYDNKQRKIIRTLSTKSIVPRV